MPRKSSNSRKPKKQPDNSIPDVKKLFDSLRPNIPVVVEQVCARLHPRPQPADREDFVEEIDIHLRENDFAHLRSFRGDADPKTWLFSVANHHIQNQLRKENRKVSLGDLSLDSLISVPDQEKKVAVEEIIRIAFDAGTKLTPRQKEVFALFLAGWSDTEISEALNIRKSIVWDRKSKAFSKIRERLGIEEKGK
jgi:RNA polymerase sigma factor (sigma-70 family)